MGSSIFVGRCLADGIGDKYIRSDLLAVNNNYQEEAR